MTTLADFIKQARELAERATPGPWTKEGKTPCGIDSETTSKESSWVVAPDDDYQTPTLNDAAFIAEARTLVPRLLDALELLREQRDSWARDTDEELYVIERQLKNVDDAAVLAILQGDK